MRGKHLVRGLARSAEEQEAKCRKQPETDQERLSDEKISEKLLATNRLPKILNLVIASSEAILKDLSLSLGRQPVQAAVMIQIFSHILDNSKSNEWLDQGGSERASEDVDDADESGRVPLDGDSSVDFVVPEAGARDVEPAVCLLHDDAIGDELEVLIDVGDALEDLDRLI